VADWGQRAKDRDRDDAIRVIEAAAARGQIIDADKQKRIQEVKAAGTVGEIEIITRGLAAPEPAATAPPVVPVPPMVSPPAPPVNPTFQPYSPPTTPPVTEPEVSAGPPPAIQYGEALTPSAGSPISVGQPIIKKGGGAGKFVLLFVLIALAGVAVPVIIGISALVDTLGDGIDINTPGGGADVFSDEGFADMVEAVEESSGSTEVFEFSMYPDYAVIYLPTEATGKRYISYRYDGSLSEFSKGSQSEDVRVDMADVKAKVLRELLADARKLVEGPTSNYVIVRPPLLGGEGPATVLAYATNDFSESGYIEATLDGKIISEHPPA
jgi:hypothetical protein